MYERFHLGEGSGGGGEEWGNMCLFLKLSVGVIHATKISGLRFELFWGVNGSRRVRMVLFHSQCLVLAEID